jgi:hypothetical protein
MQNKTRLIALLLLLCFALQPVALHAQQAGDGQALGDFLAGAETGRGPVMRSVFWNTLYGSLWGASLGVSYHFLSGVAVRESIAGSMTIGGMMGFGLGLYLVVNGLSFNQNILIDFPEPQFGPPADMETPVAQREQESAPIAFWAAPSPEGDAWEAGFQLRF